MSWKIPLFRIHADEKDSEAVEKVIRRAGFWANGPEVEEFERALADYVGTRHAVVFNSGTSALHAMLLAHDIKKEVIVPSFTFMATANSVVLAQAKPVFADIEENTYGLSVKDVKEKISDKTEAVMIVHYAGCPASDVQAIRELCKEKGIYLFEDAAGALGARIGEKKAGTFGDAAVFSFCQNKIITTGEGGCVVTNSEKIAERLKKLRSHGRVDRHDYFMESREASYIEAGYNFRMPSMCAALGLAQLKKIEKLIEMRNKNAEMLNKKLEGAEGIMPLKAPAGSRSVHQIYTIRVASPEKCDSLRDFLEKEKIMTKVYFSPIHKTSLFSDEGSLPATEKAAREVLSLPFSAVMTDDELNLLAEKIIAWCKK